MMENKDLNEVFTEKGFPFKTTEHKSFLGSIWYRYEFMAGGVQYSVLFSIKPLKESNTGKIVMVGSVDFSADNVFGASNVNHKRISDTIRVLQTIGDIIEKHKNSIDYIKISSVAKRIKSYKALIGLMQGFEIAHSDEATIYLKRLGPPAKIPKSIMNFINKQKEKESDLSETIIRKLSVQAFIQNLTSII